MAAPDDNFPWLKLLLFFNAALLALLLNPWLDVGVFAWVIVAIELAVIVFWLFPVFLYQTLVKRRPARESLRHAAKSLTETLTYF